jgi:ubiquinone/menaquinone biosynthesis C-methylase UbiE
MLEKYDLENHLFGIKKNIPWSKVRKRNIIWWQKVGRKDIKEKPETKRKNYDVFLEDIKDKTNITLDSIKDENVGEVCCGPYGGIIQAYDLQCKQKYFIDIFMDDFKNMKFTQWPDNSVFINAPCEQIHLEDNCVDTLFGYNSIDHGWDWKSSIDECLRISKKMFLMFDTKGKLDKDDHPQVITHDDVLEYIEEQGWKKKFQYVLVQARYKDYGYYETRFKWPETWVYVIK